MGIFLLGYFFLQKKRTIRPFDIESLSNTPAHFTKNSPYVTLNYISIDKLITYAKGAYRVKREKNESGAAVMDRFGDLKEKLRKGYEMRLNK